MYYMYIWKVLTCLSYSVHVYFKVMYYVLHSSLHVIIPLTQDGATPLYIASHEGHSDVVNILMRNRSDINMAFKVQS